jgi:hypothetical protein
LGNEVAATLDVFVSEVADRHQFTNSTLSFLGMMESNVFFRHPE